MKQPFILVLVLAVAAVASVTGQTIDLSRYRLVDLSHSYGPATLYWPTATTKFVLTRDADGPTPGGWFYASNTLSTPEHGGTHLDAPRHFSEKGRTTEQVPLEQLVARAVVIDVTKEEVAKVPQEQRDGWVLQEKIEYAPAITMPDGNGVKVEVRMMLLRPPDGKTLTPILPLVRLSRGKMLGVDFNKNLTWVGGTVGIFTA